MMWMYVLAVTHQQPVELRHLEDAKHYHDIEFKSHNDAIAEFPEQFEYHKKKYVAIMWRNLRISSDYCMIKIKSITLVCCTFYCTLIKGIDYYVIILLI